MNFDNNFSHDIKSRNTEGFKLKFTDSVNVFHIGEDMKSIVALSRGGIEFRVTSKSKSSNKFISGVNIGNFYEGDMKSIMASNRM